MHAKKMMVGGMGLALFLVVLLCGGLWGFEKYIDASILLEQLDSKVNGPALPVTSTFEGSLLNKQQSLETRVSLLEHFLLLPKDFEGRTVLKRADMEYLSTQGDWTWHDVWNEDGSPQHGTSTLLFTSSYQLRIPYNPDWGNAAYTVAPYEREGEDVLFGILHSSEMTGAYREARFSVAEKKPLEQVMSDPMNQTESCVGERVAPTVVHIGTYRVVRVVKDNCEMGGVTYILPGEISNYHFSSYGDERILKWTIEHFKEEK